MTLLPHDRDVLRRLGERKRSLADHPVNQERRRAWYALDDGGTDARVMVLAEHGGIRDRELPQPDSLLECTDPWARGIEKGLRSELYRFDTLQDDYVIEPFINTNWQVALGNYGVAAVMHDGSDAEHMGSRVWEAPIKDLDRDFGALRPRVFRVDREATACTQAQLESVFAGILPVRRRGGFYWTMGLTWPAIELIGLEGLMMAMYDNPDGLHRLMAFLRDDHLALIRWLEAEGLYSLNNENDYIGSGSMGYTRALPHAPVVGAIQARDLWGLLESQETVGVGPLQFEEFIFPYQAAVGAQFGRTYYGCCEPVHSRWHILKRLPNLARVSISPWADQAFMAAALGDQYVFSRKPNPTQISTDIFDEAAIRADLRETLAITRGCRVELLMKDVHTLHNEPQRLPRWVQLAREEAERAGR